MFTLFALLHDPERTLNNDSLMHDLRHKFAFIRDYTLREEKLDFPDTTIVVLEKALWRVKFSIRPDDDMTLDTTILHKLLRKKATLPENFLQYNVEIAIGFGNDPEQTFTDDIICIGEFIRDNYPGVVIYDQYNVDVW